MIALASARREKRERVMQLRRRVRRMKRVVIAIGVIEGAGLITVAYLGGFSV